MAQSGKKLRLAKESHQWEKRGPTKFPKAAFRKDTPCPARTVRAPGEQRENGGFSVRVPSLVLERPSCGCSRGNTSFNPGPHRNPNRKSQVEMMPPPRCRSGHLFLASFPEVSRGAAYNVVCSRTDTCRWLPRLVFGPIPPERTGRGG